MPPSFSATYPYSAISNLYGKFSWAWQGLKDITSKDDTTRPGWRIINITRSLGSCPINLDKMLHSQLSASLPLPKLGFIATVICLLDVVHGAAINSNATIVLPPPLSNHGDPRLVCRPTKWTDVIAFYLANYVL